jgi:hypothetical protein
VPLCHYAFLVKADGCSRNTHTAAVAGVAFTTHLIGVDDFTAAVDACTELLAQGVQLIELCDGFSADEARRLRLRIGHQVPVGVVAERLTWMLG